MNCIGNYDYYANSIYTYYTNFLDVIAYDIRPKNHLYRKCVKCDSLIRRFAENIRVIELKRDYLSDGLKIVDQIKRYMKWANTVLNPTAHVSGFIVANGFNKEYLEFIENNYGENIHLIQYSIEDSEISLTSLM